MRVSAAAAERSNADHMGTPVKQQPNNRQNKRCYECFIRRWAMLGLNGATKVSSSSQDASQPGSRRTNKPGHRSQVDQFRRESASMPEDIPEGLQQRF